MGRYRPTRECGLCGVTVPDFSNSHFRHRRSDNCDARLTLKEFAKKNLSPVSRRFRKRLDALNIQYELSIEPVGHIEKTRVALYVQSSVAELCTTFKGPTLKFLLKKTATTPDFIKELNVVLKLGGKAEFVQFCMIQYEEESVLNVNRSKIANAVRDTQRAYTAFAEDISQHGVNSSLAYEDMKRNPDRYVYLPADTYYKMIQAVRDQCLIVSEQSLKKGRPRLDNNNTRT